MNPLGMRIGTIKRGTNVYQVSTKTYVMLSETIRVNLIARRNNTYSFVMHSKEYIVHADDVTLE